MFNVIVRMTFPALCLSALIGCVTTGVSTVSTKDFLQNSSVSEEPISAKFVGGDTMQISVEVDGRMEVSRYRVGVNNLGLVTLPLVGDVKVGGMTLESARVKILKAYSSYYVNPPVIMLSMTSAQAEGEWGYVTVMGRVGKPGRVALPDADGISLTEAIQAAGGFAMGAKQGDVRVSRVDRSGKKIQASVDFKEIGQEGSADSDINLVDGDIIYVPERIF